MTANSRPSKSSAGALGIAALASSVSIGLALLIVWTIGGFASPALGDSNQGDPVPAIKAMLDQQERDWNKGNLDAFLEGYWNSPRVVFQSGGDRNIGFEAMRERYRKRYQAEGRAMGRVTFSDVEIEPLSADAAFVRGRWGLTMPDGKTPGGLFTLIVRKLPEGWKIVHDHTSSAEVPAKPAPAPDPPATPAQPPK